MLTDDQLTKLSERLQELFRAVAPSILSAAGNTEHSNKADGTPFTDTDVAVEHRIVGALTKDFPDLNIQGEESGYDETAIPNGCLLIDPIDGTKSFIQNIPTFTSMAVYIYDNQPILSVIYNPSSDEMFVAIKNRGATCNGALLELSKMSMPPVAYCKQQFKTTFDNLLADSGVSCEEHSLGAGYGFTMVAAGKSAARFNIPGQGHIHDYAPGALLVQESGGMIITENDQYNSTIKNFVACHPDLGLLLTSKKQALFSRP